MSGWDIKLDGVSIKDKISSATIHKGKGLFCKELELKLHDKAFLDQFDFAEIPTAPTIEVFTEIDGNWQSEGVFFAEEPGTTEDKDSIVHTLYGRDISARLSFPFATRISKEWPEETTLFAINEEILEGADLEYSAARMLINDYTVYPNTYSVTGWYPIDIVQDLAGKTDGFLYTDRLGQIWIIKDEYSWSAVETEIHAGMIQTLTERVEHPEFGNRVHVGSFSKKGDANVDISLEPDETYMACGEGISAKAVVTHLDGSPVADGYPVSWTSDNNNYASWENATTHVHTHLIPAEPQEATSRYQVSTDHPIRQVHSVTEVATGETKAVASAQGRSIALSEPLTFTDSAVLIDYETGYATNTLVAGSTGEVEVSVHAIVEVWVRDTATMRIDTASGEATAEQAAFITVVTKDAISNETITNPGNVRLDDVLKGQTASGIIDLGLIPGGQHSISIRDVSGYQNTDAPDGLANDILRVLQPTYVTTSDEKTTNPNLITNHDDLSNIKGHGTQHLSVAELASLSSFSIIGHTHDGRYYTEDEVDLLLAGLTTDHGGLLGLSDDDHSQYALLAGRVGDVLNIEEIRALNGDGLVLADDSGTQGIFIQDGGALGLLRSSNTYGGVEFTGAMRGFVDNSSVQFMGRCFSDTAGHGVVISGLKYKGTEDSPAAVTDTHRMFSFIGRGWDGNSDEIAIQLLGKVEGTVGEDKVPGQWLFRTADSNGTLSDVLCLDAAWNVLINGATAGTDMVGGISMAVGTSPTANAANCVSIYPEDVGGKAEVFVMDEDGNDTQVSSHNTSLYTPDPSQYYPFSFFAKNNFIGRKINADIYGTVDAVERLTEAVFGSREQFIYTEDLPTEEIIDWDEHQIWCAMQHDKKEQGRIADEVATLVEKEVEVTKAEAIEYAEITELVDSKTEKIKVIDKSTGDLVEKPQKIEKGTGKSCYRLKKGYHLDKKTGKFYRNKTETEALAEVDPATTYTPKSLPPWLASRVPVKTKAKKQ